MDCSSPGSSVHGDSPGKNTEAVYLYMYIYCFSYSFLLYTLNVVSCAYAVGPGCLSILDIESEGETHSVMSHSLRPHGLYSPWNSLGQNTGVGSLSLLQGIFPTQGSNPGLPHCG